MGESEWRWEGIPAKCRLVGILTAQPYLLFPNILVIIRLTVVYGEFACTLIH